MLYTAHQKRARPENEHSRLGDEVYYLGLLYTLTSLCAALVTLFLLDEWSRIFGGEVKLTLEQRTDEMIGSFGIALLTTIAGNRYSHDAPRPRAGESGDDCSDSAHRGAH